MRPMTDKFCSKRVKNPARQAKIVATLGPASSDVDVISDLMLAGMDVARLNMSHGTQRTHSQLIDNIRTASGRVGKETAILLDLQGPKIRVGSLSRELRLTEGEIWLVGPAEAQSIYPGYGDRFIPTLYDHLADDCLEGERILFDDGLIIAEVLERDRSALRIKVLAGGVLLSNKGMNLPDSKITAPSFTEKDRKDLEFGIEHEVDYIALSFVREKDDIIGLKGLLLERNSGIPVVAKIEKPEAIRNIEEITNASDVIMIARGDMGVEIGNHLVPAVQKRIISLCNHYGKPVITATQMLESMVENPSPTRAESSDVANAIWDGTDAVMLSAETASGRYPLEAVRMMGMIMSEAEKTPKPRPSLKTMDLTSIDNAIMIGASIIAEKIHARRILSVTESGSSSLKMSRFRPQVPVVGVSNSLSVVRRMCLYWGVAPFYLDTYDEDHRDLEKYVIAKIREEWGLEHGDRIVITRGGGRFFAKGSSNSIKVEILQ